MFSDLSVFSNTTGLDYPILDRTLPFSQYIMECRALIQERRLDLQNNVIDATQIIDVNSPYELYPFPHKRIKYGALLIHGLWDCPFSLKEIATYMQAQGILSRAILLPGHGTRPSDLQQITYQDWIQTVSYGVQTLQQEVEHLFLIGYSTGAALSLHEALQNNRIAGVILLAPAIRINPVMDLVLNWHYLMKWVSKNKKWIYLEKEIDYAKYKSIGLNPVMQIHQLTQVIQKQYQNKTVACPIFMSMSDDDETISSAAAMQFFLKLHHPNSQLLLYTTRQKKYADPRILLRNSQYPHLDIENFSHVALPFSPNNFHYGQQGDYIYASRPADKARFGAYNRVWERFYKPFYQLGMIKACKRELTYNPDFNFMTEAMLTFIKSVTGA